MADPFDSPDDRSGPGPLYEGDVIRADGDGGYEGLDCCGDD